MVATFLVTTLFLTHPPMTSQQALERFNPLIGEWKATGYPKGNRRASGFWTETIDVAWQFDKEQPSIHLTFNNGKYFQEAHLRYQPKFARYELDTVDATGQTATQWSEPYADISKLSFQAEESATVRNQLHIQMLHSNRFLLWSESRSNPNASFSKDYSLGATKQGVAFANVPMGNVCIVTGGEAKTPVQYMGKTYYVCCSGCKAVFEEDPEKFLGK